MSDWILYGANGFTGRLIAERAKQRGMRPILAGRNTSMIRQIARALDLPCRVFSLDPAAIRREIAGASLVLHCAGPYSATSRPMVEACLRAGVSYLDLTGEFEVLSEILSHASRAKAQSVVLLPAVGFDVVPTDCVAARLAAELPDATELNLAFSGGMKPSPGTAKTTVEGLHFGQRVRRDGDLVKLPEPVVREVPFAAGARGRTVMSIPWGDIVTAYHSTGIPNITVYTEASPALIRAARLLRYAAPVLRSALIQNFLKRQVEKRASGPSESDRRNIEMWIWGEVRNAQGDRVEGHLRVPDGYELTVLAALESVQRVLGGEVPPGATTPSRAFGPEFVTELEGVGDFRISTELQRR